MNSLVRIAAAMLGLELMLQPTNSQQPTPTFQTGVTLVNVPVTVRNNGTLVTDLDKNDFEILDEGKRQKISYFARQFDVSLNIDTDNSLNVALLLDVSGSVLHIIGNERTTAGQFFEQVLHAHDSGIVVAFADSVLLWQDFTSSTDVLKAALTRVKPFGSGKTVLYDAITFTAAEKLRFRTGTKIMVVISDGLDTASEVNLESAVAMAQATEVVVYSICEEGPANSAMDQFRRIQLLDPIRYAPGCSALKAISEATGGRLLSISKSVSVQKVFESIREEIRGQYLLGFSPSNPARPGTFRKLQIKTTHGDLTVQSRQGYYTPKATEH